jgi:hypothetical protein
VNGVPRPAHIDVINPLYPHVAIPAEVRDALVRASDLVLQGAPQRHR